MGWLFPVVPFFPEDGSVHMIARSDGCLDLDADCSPAPVDHGAEMKEVQIGSLRHERNKTMSVLRVVILKRVPNCFYGLTWAGKVFVGKVRKDLDCNTLSRVGVSGSRDHDAALFVGKYFGVTPK